MQRMLETGAELSHIRNKIAATSKHLVAVLCTKSLDNKDFLIKELQELFKLEKIKNAELAEYFK